MLWLSVSCTHRALNGRWLWPHCLLHFLCEIIPSNRFPFYIDLSFWPVYLSNVVSWTMSPQKMQSPNLWISLHGTLCGNTVFAHITKCRWSYWIQWALTPMTVFCVSRERFGDLQTNLDWGGHVTTEAATSQWKLRILVTSRSRMRQEPSKRAWACQHLGFRFLGFENHEKILFLS